MAPKPNSVYRIPAGTSTPREKYPFGPLKRPRNFPWGVYDIETKSKESLEFHCVGFYDGTEYRYFTDMGAFLDHVLAPRYDGWRFFAHFGGRFDVHYVFDWLREHEPMTPISFICAGANVIALTVFSGKRYWRFCDSYRLLPASLKTLTREFDVEHKKLEFAPLDPEYNRHDCLGLYEVLTKFFDQFGLTRETLAGYAMAAFRTRFQRYMIRPVSDDIEEFVRAGYFGGRCELFRYDRRRVNHYDVNSMYPAAMLEPVPVEYLGHTTRLPEDDNRIGFYLAEVHYPDVYLPVLPVLHQNRLFFPTGGFRGLFSSIELRRAIMHGAAVRILNGVLFHADRFLEPYARELYSIKVRAEKDGNPALRYIAKIMLNSLYGKFGQNRVQRVYMLDDGSPGLYPLPGGLAWRHERSNAPHIMPHIAATITARARARLHAMLEDAGSVWYTDTDSIFTDRQLPVGDGIGALHCEGAGVFCGYRAKEYEYDGRIKVKGVPREDQALAAAYLRQETISYERMAGLPESVARGNRAVRRVITKRTMRPGRDKRCRIGDDSRPWRFSELRGN